MGMEWMFLDYIILVVVAGLIVLVALQASKTDVSSALSGTSSDLFKNQKERGSDLLLVRATFVFSALFIILLLIRTLIG